MTRNEIRIALLTMPARFVLALTVWAEARGESAEGRAAVAWVIKNRAAKRHQTIQAVCLQRNQFSCWWGDDPNSDALYARAESCLLGESSGDLVWIETASIARRVLLGTLPDPTSGADHYVTTALYRSAARPFWIAAMPVTAVVDHHTFMRSQV